jgi:hypothetical protein
MSKKTYTHLEALILAAQNPGRVFVDRLGVPTRVNQNGCVEYSACDVSDTWVKTPDGFRDICAPFTDPEELRPRESLNLSVQQAIAGFWLGVGSEEKHLEIARAVLAQAREIAREEIAAAQPKRSKVENGIITAALRDTIVEIADARIESAVCISENFCGDWEEAPKSKLKAGKK